MFPRAGGVYVFLYEAYRPEVVVLPRCEHHFPEELQQESIGIAIVLLQVETVCIELRVPEKMDRPQIAL